jgi:hypothetical protein
MFATNSNGADWDLSWLHERMLILSRECLFFIFAFPSSSIAPCDQIGANLIHRWPMLWMRILLMCLLWMHQTNVTQYWVEVLWFFAIVVLLTNVNQYWFEVLWFFLQLLYCCDIKCWVPYYYWIATWFSLLGWFSGLGLNVFYFGLDDGCRCLEELIRGTVAVLGSGRPSADL